MSEGDFSDEETLQQVRSEREEHNVEPQDVPIEVVFLLHKLMPFLFI